MVSHICRVRLQNYSTDVVIHRNWDSDWFQNECLSNTSLNIYLWLNCGIWLLSPQGHEVNPKPQIRWDVERCWQLDSSNTSLHTLRMLMHHAVHDQHHLNSKLTTEQWLILQLTMALKHRNLSTLITECIQSISIAWPSKLVTILPTPVPKYYRNYSKSMYA